MLNVDPLLQGRAICLRPSMKKFEAPGSMTIEVAAVFNRPTRFYLNRYLIMLLEGLKVEGGYGIFKELQDAVIQDTKNATKSFGDAAKLCEGYGLGNAFKLPSIFLDLAKLGVHHPNDVFTRQILNFGIYHVLRDLKYGARVPVPGGYTLVGVADVHQHLEDGEILACVSQGIGEKPIYLEGPTMIARSPTVHPGDVQVVHAIGRPPKGSIFDREPLMNTVVFSTLGSRPLASCLAGGDLDGDVFVCTTLEGLLPTVTYLPADYDTAEKKVLPRPSVRADVADFITEYLYSDNIGIIASTWLVLADQSDQGILDPDCLLLAKLHSNATDYPKSGLPVPMEDVPRYKLPRIKPDWNAPEVAEHASLGLYYESRRCIGCLYREVQLTDPQTERPNRHYVQTLRHIAASFNIAYRRVARLTEEEVVVGTIIAQSSQPRMRQGAISEMREQGSILVNRIAIQLAGPDGDDKEEMLKRAWLAYRISTLHPDAFGSRSFGIVAMHEIFDAVKSIEAIHNYLSF
ncbi:hypothetical protein PHLGIDRAFT_503395 [Phlebiopsis gigantea 11061_1 CR5-6]|uniref:RNA-dependent RNA polymerase n=1 Tax=Phlebiopsis gigantea (strain 11061_1 CR5-6) TaxID=745531 RepID=A0A0C3SDF1_PHLG1|nr:hypothetical protein PHLGIDRAFT_503395 [Phlebiopsis gigantea 11061_1 CR5-6]